MKTKNIIIITLLIVIALMAIGYAAFAQVLTINGTSNIAGNWNVRINSIAEGNLTGAVSKTAAVVGNDKLSATFDVDLKYPGAVANYIITVENAGTINAILESVNGIDVANATQPTDIRYTINATAGDTLTSGQTKEYTVTVEWLDVSTPTEMQSKTATITLNYVQNT